ncbi:hypothetical protein GOP47_0014540 [Adiantum capillus-veneris]|uniref:Uncharacterized protein n=1 Tax=Adiantum capillus-veneris TaxID=13818 RepID=A0A9D4UMH6_ADICA|nr:hypothetical protein GOP47_0014540 [Adiantum capillus-veneris]
MLTRDRRLNCRAASCAELYTELFLQLESSSMESQSRPILLRYYGTTHMLGSRRAIATIARRLRQSPMCKENADGEDKEEGPGVT